MKFDKVAPAPLRRVTRIAGMLVILAAAVVTIGGLLGLPVFPSDIDNSRKNEVAGCYFIGKDLVGKVDKDRIDFAGISSPYEVGLALLPNGLLRAKPSTAGWRIVKVQGRPEFIPVTLGDRAALNLLTVDGQSIGALKRPCR
jgi:hypothetical protein